MLLDAISAIMRRMASQLNRAARGTLKQYHIGINAQLLSSRAGYRRAGIHHYIWQLLRHLPPAGRQPHTGDETSLRYTVFTGQLDAAPLAGRVCLAQTTWPTHRPAWRILWEQLVWPVAAIRHGVDLMHSMAFVTPLLSACPMVVTVYDLSFIHYPERFPTWQQRYLAGQTRRSCRQARRIVAISEAGRQDIHACFEVPLAQIDVVTPGVDTAFHPRPRAEVEDFRRREGLPEHFLLHVGTLQPRKNIPLLLEALALLQQPDLLLVLAGGKGWFYDDIFARVQALGLEQQVRFTGYVPDADLPLWYSAASLLLFPSVYEGFGMPVIQAMACGTAVVAAYSSAVPEAAGDAALFFDPHDASALAEQIGRVLDNPDLAAKMTAQGFEQARRFSWSESGRKLATTYQRALASR
jgi:glycosyltransferase involved in cell wall biosynthesis